MRTRKGPLDPQDFSAHLHMYTHYATMYACSSSAGGLNKCLGPFAHEHSLLVAAHRDPKSLVFGLVQKAVSIWGISSPGSDKSNIMGHAGDPADRVLKITGTGLEQFYHPVRKKSVQHTMLSRHNSHNCFEGSKWLNPWVTDPRLGRRTWFMMHCRSA